MLKRHQRKLAKAKSILEPYPTEVEDQQFRLEALRDELLAKDKDPHEIERILSDLADIWHYSTEAIAKIQGLLEE